MYIGCEFGSKEAYVLQLFRGYILALFWMYRFTAAVTVCNKFCTVHIECAHVSSVVYELRLVSKATQNYHESGESMEGGLNITP
jgi:hypothetical protein